MPNTKRKVELWGLMLMGVLLSSAYGVTARDEPSTFTTNFRTNFSVNFPGGNSTTSLYDIYSLLGEFFAGAVSTANFGINLSFWNTNNKSVEAVVNSAPSVTILHPANNSFHSSANVSLNVSGGDVNNDALTFYHYVDASFNETSTVNRTKIFTEGNHSYTSQAFDGSLFSPNSTVNFTVDLTMPVLDWGLNSFANGSSLGQNWLFVNFTLAELNPLTVRVFLNNSKTGNVINETLTTQWYINVTGLGVGNYTVWGQATDKAGNVNITPNNRTVELQGQAITQLWETSIFVIMIGALIWFSYVAFALAEPLLKTLIFSTLLPQATLIIGAAGRMAADASASSQIITLMNTAYQIALWLGIIILAYNGVTLIYHYGRAYGTKILGAMRG